MPAHSLSLLTGGLVALAFIGMVAFIVRSTPAPGQARVLTAAATLVAVLPAVLFALYGR